MINYNAVSNERAIKLKNLAVACDFEANATKQLQAKKEHLLNILHDEAEQLPIYAALATGFDDDRAASSGRVIPLKMMAVA